MGWAALTTRAAVISEKELTHLVWIGGSFSSQEVAKEQH